MKDGHFSDCHGVFLATSYEVNGRAVYTNEAQHCFVWFTEYSDWALDSNLDNLEAVLASNASRAACARGYEQATGPLQDRWGLSPATDIVYTCNDCGALCDQDQTCLAYECSEQQNDDSCWLSTWAEPNREKYRDFVWCSKTNLAQNGTINMAESLFAGWALYEVVPLEEWPLVLTWSKYYANHPCHGRFFLSSYELEGQPVYRNQKQGCFLGLTSLGEWTVDDDRFFDEASQAVAVSSLSSDSAAALQAEHGRFASLRVYLGSTDRWRGDLLDTEAAAAAGFYLKQGIPF